MNGLAAGGNLRLITERPRAGSERDPTTRLVVCTEPSPDYLVTFNRSADVSAQVSVSDKVTDSGKLNLTANEAGSEGAGRTAGVLALRDGLYAACQAYVNGMIGMDAYSVILSQYGLLVSAVANGTPAKATAGLSSAGKPSSAFAAILVACLSGNDPTRLTFAHERNPLLSPAACRRAIQLAASGRAG